jgi:hypothetical protein
MSTAKKIIYWVSGTLIVFYASFIILSYFFTTSLSDAYWGGLAGETLSRKVFNKAFDWPSSEKYEIEYGRFSPDTSSACALMVHLTQRIQKSSENVIVGFCDATRYYFPDTCEIISGCELDSPIKITSTIDQQNYQIVMLFPKTIFNARKIPQGNRLGIFGLAPESTRNLRIGSLDVKIMTAPLWNFSLLVLPNDEFIKNIPIQFKMHGQYGSLIFITDENNRTVFMVHYIKNMDKETYPVRLNEFLDELKFFHIKDFKKGVKKSIWEQEKEPHAPTNGVDRTGEKGVSPIF